MLGKMKGNEHLAVSFKLETDVDILKDRVDFAIEKYGVDVVVGNCLKQKEWVSLTYNQETFKDKHGEVYSNL
jgi:hypothetical protein